jgi:hypothetical protein
VTGPGVDYGSRESDESGDSDESTDIEEVL